MSPEARSRVMRAIRSRWTSQERAFAALCTRWERGGKEEFNADFIFRHVRVAVFLDGDFWHGRNLPDTLPTSWRAKLERNSERDARNRQALEADGWEVVSIWESDFNSDRAGWVDHVMSLVKSREVDGSWRI